MSQPLLLATNPRKPLDSAVLVQISQSSWELRELRYQSCRCWGTGYEHDKAMAAGDIEECYKEADRLGFHIDIITPRKDL